MRKKKVEVNSVVVNNKYEFILLSAMRYAVGRMSYAPHLVSEYIKEVCI